MIKILKKILIFAPACIFFGCGTGMHLPMDDIFRGPQEMYAWKPASLKKLILRSETQKTLDEIASMIKGRDLANEGLREEIQILQETSQAVEPKLKSIISQVEIGTNEILDNFKSIKTEMASIETSGLGLSNDFKKYDKYLELQKPFDPEEYLQAVLLFKKSKFKESIRSFKKLLKKNPPYFLMDNIYFGIGTSYYKAKKFDKALKIFDMIPTKYPNGDKWPTAYVMIGLIYNETSRKSKALYKLESALGKYMKPEDRKLIKRLLVLIQKDSYAGS